MRRDMDTPMLLDIKGITPGDARKRQEFDSEHIKRSIPNKRNAK
jgi:hypothetical protein